MTAKCSVNSTWGPLDMSQCTFRSDVQVAGVAVVEIVTDSDIQANNIQVTLVNSCVNI